MTASSCPAGSPTRTSCAPIRTPCDSCGILRLRKTGCRHLSRSLDPGGGRRGEGSAPDFVAQPADGIRNAGGHWVDEPLVECGNGPNLLISSRKPDDLDAFCAALIRNFARPAHQAAKRPFMVSGEKEAGRSRAVWATRYQLLDWQARGEVPVPRLAPGPLNVRRHRGRRALPGRLSGGIRDQCSLEPPRRYVGISKGQPHLPYCCGCRCSLWCTPSGPRDTGVWPGCSGSRPVNPSTSLPTAGGHPAQMGATDPADCPNGSGRVVYYLDPGGSSRSGSRPGGRRVSGLRAAPPDSSLAGP